MPNFKQLVEQFNQHTDKSKELLYKDAIESNVSLRHELTYMQEKLDKANHLKREYFHATIFFILVSLAILGTFFIL